MQMAFLLYGTRITQTSFTDKEEFFTIQVYVAIVRLFIKRLLQSKICSSFSFK